MSGKKRAIIISACLLSVVFIACLILLRGTFSGQTPTTERTGGIKTVYLGTYPQSRVDDAELIGRLEQTEQNWQSYRYFNGDGTLGSAKQSDYMQYADVELGGERYRAVRFSEYRSFCAHLAPLHTSNQEALFELNKTYWYRFEPVKWIVLSESENLLMSEMVLDSQAINNVIYSKTPEKGFDSLSFYKDASFGTYATDYATSDIREWLNSDFLETAFSAREAGRIVESELDNSAWSGGYSKYDSPATRDKVFLLSYKEATTPEYGFNRLAEATDRLRIGVATDYAVSQGICVSDGPYGEKAAWWWLRSAGVSSALNNGVNFHGSIRFTLTTTYTPDCNDTGIRPAIRLDSLD